MLFTCLAEKFSSRLHAIKGGEYFNGETTCTYSFDAIYFWDFFALLSLVFLIGAVSTIKHGKYRPQSRLPFFWPFFVILAMDFVDYNVYGGNNGHNLCLLLSQVPGIDCGQVLGVLVTYAVLSAAVSHYIKFRYVPHLKDLQINHKKRISRLSQDKSIKRKEALTDHTPARKIWLGPIPPIPPNARIGSSGNPQDWWKPSPTELNLLYRAQSNSSFKSKSLQVGIETVTSVASGMVTYLCLSNLSLALTLKYRFRHSTCLQIRCRCCCRK